MTGPRGDDGFSVAPRRLGGEPARRRRGGIGVGIVIAVIAAVVAIGWLGPRINQRPNFDFGFFATPTPGRTPTPSPTRTPTTTGTPRPTALPEITRPAGPTAVGQVAFVTDALHVLDLAAGSNTGGLVGRPGDAVFPARDGDGWICVCLSDPSFDATGNILLTLVRTDADGRPIATLELGLLPPGHGPSFQVPTVTVDVDVFDDGHRALIAVARREHDEWEVSVAALDLDRAILGPFTELGTTVLELPASIEPPSPDSEPTPTPEPAPQVGGPDERYLDGPNVRVAPDGRTAFVWGVEYGNGPESVVGGTVSAWRTTIEADGTVSAAGPAPGLETLPAFCGAVGFAADDRLAWYCPDVRLDGSSPVEWQIGTVDLKGEAAASLQTPISGDLAFGGAQPLFDQANGRIYAWDPRNLTMVRYDAHTLAEERMTYDRAAQSTDGGPLGGGDEPARWELPSSAIPHYGYSMHAGSIDGRRIYALGVSTAGVFGSISEGSLGIFVIDRATLALVDRWAPAADYLGLSVLENGDVAASGMPNLDEHGREAPWQASLTVHDDLDGRILVRFGQLGMDFPPLLIAR